MSIALSKRAWAIALKNEALASEFVDQYAGEGIQLREGGKRYKGSRPLILAHRQDFEQASLLGLARGAEKWNSGEGALSTYAAYYVHEELNKETKSHRATEERSGPRPSKRPSSGKKTAMKMLAEGDCAPSAEDQSFSDTPSHTKGTEASVGKPAASPPPDERRTEANSAGSEDHLPSETAPKANYGVGFRDASKAISFLEQRGEHKLAGDVRVLSQEVIKLRRELKRKLFEDEFKALADYAIRYPDDFEDGKAAAKAGKALLRNYYRNQAKRKKED